MCIPSITTSDAIQLIGIGVSLLVAVIAIVISIITLRQNSKMIEESTRATISIYGVAINTGSPMFYLVVKNFGNTPAVITKFESDFDLSTALHTVAKRNYIEQLKNCIIAPNQSRICMLESTAIEQPVTFDIEYRSGLKNYKDQITVDLVAGADMFIGKTSTKGEELRTISYTLQEMLQKNL